MYLVAEITLHKGKRKSLPASGYRPDIIIDGIEDSYWGVIFTNLNLSDFDVANIAEMRFTFQLKHYDEVSVGQTFKIMEGPHQVGKGEILSVETESSRHNTENGLTHKVVGLDIEELYAAIEILIVGLTGDDYNERFKKGLALITEYINNGGEQKAAYDKLNLLFEKYQDIDEQKSDLIGDWLDCICGWIGNKEFAVWECIN